MRRPVDDTSLGRVRAARRDSTPAERKLWSKLRARQLGGLKFRRQVWLGTYIADFFCAEAKLVVEVDGDTHAAQVGYDQRRTEWVAREGFRVIRFANRDVLNNIEGVIQQLLLELPSPSQSDEPTGPLPLP